MYTTSTAFLDALCEAGVSHIFANLGSDHTAIIESLAEAKAVRRRVPRLITCPNEMVALSAAQGFAQLTGIPQAVIVHVECGTQALAGAVHNAARARIPVLIFAGESPITQNGELRGSRNEFIHWIQDVFDQRGLVRGYMKYDYEIRTGVNVKQIVHRALQLARSEPKGPVYLMGAREVLEQEAPSQAVDMAQYATLGLSGLSSGDIAIIAGELAAARRPLIVTSYLGRSTNAVAQLVQLCDRVAIAVLDSVPTHLNLPTNHPMYQGSQGNEPQQNRVLAEADVILLLDTDVPWIPSVNHPAKDARIYHVDTDPLKERISLWHFPAQKSFRADCATVLKQINDFLAEHPPDETRVDERRVHYETQHRAMRDALRAAEQVRGDAITVEHLTAAVRERCDRDTIFLNEGITNYKPIADHLQATAPLTLFTSGGSSLGWGGGAAIGMKLALPEKTIVCLTGDGSFMFSQPSTVHWMARQYQTPFLQVIYNNRGWKAPKISTLAVHPDGYASKTDDFGVCFDPPPDYAGIAAAAGGAFARTVRRNDELASALDEAFRAIREESRCAVLDVWLDHL